MKSSSATRLLVIAACFATSLASPLRARDDSVKLDGVKYVNKGLVGFGRIPSDFRESTGDTLGGIGSAIAFKRGTWTKKTDGTYAGTLVVRPDRGFNVETTVDYQARQHDIDFVLTPYTKSKKLSFDDAQKTLELTYKSTTLMFERNGVKTSGLDGLAVRPAQNGFPGVADADPEMPIPSQNYSHLSLDVEGLVAAADGSYWISDEYGPYIYHFTADGNLISTIQPPAAILPKDKNGNLNFTSEENPATGRTPNQGFEGLTMDFDKNILYAMLQSATIQDGGDDDSTSRHTRLVAYDVSDSSVRPALVGEWVVPLPISNDKGKTRASSEIHFVSENIFLSLSRDGKGHGNDDSKSKYKQADLFSIAAATDIHGTEFDDPSNPVAPGGVLDSSIVPATYVSFVDYIDDKQLARFGLHNGGDFDEKLIDGKWESLAIAPVEDPESPDDYFLFTAADNDFISTHGVSLGVPFDAGDDVDTQVFVFLVTLPSVPQGSIQRALGVAQ
ncbi:hypothetical protein AAF712_001662 [Marasmius tenuissimus]|uniref:Phytase-like domain-containing protein n=1 Tax=Marasmius tenuissimus TaxID=585030 RepID=A0ABR3ACP5_9AGAR